MHPDLIPGIISVIFGTVYTSQAIVLPKANIGNPWAPIYFPLSLGVLLVAFGIGLILKARAEKRAAGKAAKHVYFDRASLFLIAGTIVICVLYAMIFEKVGFIIATMLFVGSLLFIVNGIKSWKVNIITSVAFTLVIWYIFEKLFYINLP